MNLVHSVGVIYGYHVLRVFLIVKLSEHKRGGQTVYYISKTLNKFQLNLIFPAQKLHT